MTNSGPGRFMLSDLWDMYSRVVALEEKVAVLTKRLDAQERP